MERKVEIREKAPVISADGVKLGEMQRLVFEPDVRRVTHVVVKRGRLFRTEERLVPFDFIDEATGTVISLDREVGVDGLGVFEESGPLPSSASGREVPAAAVVVSAGDVVQTADGRRVGSLRHVFTDPNGTVTELAVEPEAKTIPQLVESEAVEHIANGVVTLSLSGADFEHRSVSPEDGPF